MAISGFPADSDVDCKDCVSYESAAQYGLHAGDYSVASVKIYYKFFPKK